MKTTFLNYLLLIGIYILITCIYYLLAGALKKYIKKPFLKALLITSLFAMFGLQMETFFSIVCPILNIDAKLLIKINENLLLQKMAIWMTAMPLGIFGYLFITVTLRKKDSMFDGSQT